MIYVFYILAALLIYLSYKSFRGGIDYLNYFKRELAKPPSNHTPLVTVFAPCKGIDQDMQANFDALLQQDYPEYEIVFIVDETDDDAAGVIESAWREAERHVKLVVAPKSVESSQKVENLREGVLHASPESEVFAFVDSDVRPSQSWLRNLVAPLSDEKVGAATGYRWFFSGRETVGSEMRNVWNASIASALGPNRRTNFSWGGSTAIRRDAFDRLNIRERWRGTLSDDFTVTRAMNEAGLDIVFVPGALTASVEDCTWHQLFEFTTRQMKITRVYSPNLWALSFFGSGLFTIVMLTALLIMIFSPKNDLPVVVAMFTLLAVTVFSIGKSWLRLNAVHLALPQYKAKLRRQFLPQITLWALAPAIFFFNGLAGLFSRRIKWRGTTYEMVSPTETRVLR
jgi:cellulose synthase/poly-beta-1,6-N-acetylglucosamine synthase-like glycosyltransferase